MTVDAVADGAYAVIATAPSPPTSGVTVVVGAGQGAVFPTAPFDLTMWPLGVLPLARGPLANAEVARCTVVSTDTLTITRNAYGYGAKAVAGGWQCGQLITKNLIDQLEAGSGPTPGVPVWTAYAFAYNDAGLDSGVSILTPTVDDLLLDAILEVDTAWDGTTPLFDFGTFMGGTSGLLSYQGVGPIDMTVADTQVGDNAGLLRGDQRGTGLASNVISGGVSLSNTDRWSYKFTATNPLYIVVSQTGGPGGGDPASSQGSAILYLQTVTPA